MHKNLTPHTWMHRNKHPSSKCTGILPLTNECTEIVTPQVNAPKTCPLHINGPKLSSLKQMHRNLTPHKWIHRNRHSSGKCAENLPLTHECTEIIIPDVIHQNLTPHTWMHRNRHYSGQCNGILPCTHECTEVITLQVNTPESYPSHKNAPKSSFLGQMHRHPTLDTGKYHNHHSSSKCTGIPLTHECT